MKKYRKIFITVGTTRFDRLIESLLLPEVKLFDYCNGEIFSKYLNDSDLIIGHAGAGTVLQVLRLNKSLLIIINDNLMDNHQKELADELSENNYVKYTDIENFAQTLRQFNIFENVRPFPSPDPLLFRNFIEKILSTTNSQG
ncbi:UDP-N-acetylglucosamine transferase subunit ALG13-like protein [Euroglyphus maynei]|uniref:UDP-N-acetylglucosamine transferase subunit ALG13 n=1 Tax=Euroglyphus maynei TaxID=6958 RepID=A0A1Y3BJU5_EURMA|nr:UDP-N-acetylglucosamine transferase subunit ALG13-like protein [Euroglyphus maynei]